MTVFRAATLRTFFFAFHAGAKELTNNCKICFLNLLKRLIVETQLKAFSGDLSKVPLIKETLQQLMLNWQCNNRFFIKAF